MPTPILLALLLGAALPANGDGGRLTPYRDRLAAAGALREAEIYGNRIVYADEGEGPAIVLIHGLGGSLYDWRRLAPLLLERGFRVIRPDLLGAGESAKPEDGDYSVVAQARRVRLLLEKIGVEGAVLCGNSYGGGVALALARDWPERVERLVLIDSVCFARDVPVFARACEIPLVPEGVVHLLPVEKTIRWILPSAKSMEDEEVRAYAAEVRAPGRREAIVETLRALLGKGAAEWEASLRTMKTPTLVLWGKKDETLPLEHGKRLVEAMPASTLAILEEAGHVPNQSHPEEVLERMLPFIAD
jgi:pimeloyl-ACP methyl ester carboxylesterase